MSNLMFDDRVEQGVIPLADVAVRLHPIDPLAVARTWLPAGRQLETPNGIVTTRQPIPPGHKVALSAIHLGDAVRRYGQIIGFAKQDIAPGDHIHTHNLGVQDFTREYEFGTNIVPVDFVPPEQRRTFMGYLRSDGRVATRNMIAIISSVNCSATVSRAIANRIRADGLRDYPNVDDVIAITHKSGCAMSDFSLLQRVLVGFAQHVNIAAYILIGLGCEGNQIIDWAPAKEAPIMTVQDTGGFQKTLEGGVEAIRQLLGPANAVRRTSQTVDKLTVALQCGGSDGWSGVTANPALGMAADEIVRQGGTVILSETPEIYGGEHLLTRRASSEAVGRKLLERIAWWEHYTAINDAIMDNNPAPGNKAGGLTTIYEKSLGAIAKSGTTPLNGVYEYGEPITEKGFVFVDTPGYDPVSVTGQVASGANLIAFTTGRGSAFGFKPAPSIKIASNSGLYNKQTDDMDVNAGKVLDGVSVRDVGMEIFDLLIETASGQKSKSELSGLGDEEFSPWPVGAVL